MSNHPLIFALISIAGNLNGNDNDDNDKTNIPPQEDLTQEMSAKPTAKVSVAAAAATKCKAAAGKPKTGETKGDFLPSSHMVSKLYGFGTEDVYAMSFDSEGTTDYCVMSLYLTGIVPEGGFNTSLLLDGFMILWSRPVDAFYFQCSTSRK